MFLFLFLLSNVLVPGTACISKESAIQCFYTTADANDDGGVSVEELTSAISEHLPWWQYKAFNFFGGIDQILKDCDANEDGILTAAEAVALPESCLETCFKRSATKHVFDC